MSVLVDNGDVERFRGIVASQFGLQFDDSKLAFLADVLRRRLEVGRQDSERYLRQLERGPRDDGESGALAQELTVGETYFFRNIDQFRAFREIALPQRQRANRDARVLRVLSAGCASGEEAYSLAMILKEAVPDPSWNIRIRAVDINPAALQRAADAHYGMWALRETPHDMRERWFHSGRRDLVLDDEIRRAVTFERKNLTADDADLWRPGFYDVVFCRNVIMYFSPEKMRAVVARIARSLAPGGYLFLGHAETLRGLSQAFHLLHTHDTFYYRLRGEDEEAEPELPHLGSSVFTPPHAADARQSLDWFEAIAQASERIRALGQTSPKTVVPSLIAAAPKWNLARVLDLVQLERFAEALELVRSMPPEASRDADVLLLTAVLLAHSGQLAAAAEVATRLLASDELNAGAHYVLALSCEGMGDQPGAVNHDHFAVYLNPEFAMPRLHLGLLAKRAGDRATARRELSQALLLLQREDASRLLLFGGGFTRDGLIALCRAELSAIDAKP